MHVQALGHVVLKVRDVQRSEAFYGGVLGIPVVGRIADPVPMVFFTLGRHHDFAVMELGQHGPSPDRHTAGLAHVAFKVGDTLDEFAAVERELEAVGVVILYELDHGFAKGMHMHDPDGNEVELFVDLPRPQTRDNEAVDKREPLSSAADLSARSELVASRPVRRILYRAWGPVMAIPLGRRLPAGSCGLPEG